MEIKTYWTNRESMGNSNVCLCNPKYTYKLQLHNKKLANAPISFFLERLAIWKLLGFVWFLEIRTYWTNREWMGNSPVSLCNPKYTYKLQLHNKKLANAPISFFLERLAIWKLLGFVWILELKVFYTPATCALHLVVDKSATLPQPLHITTKFWPLSCFPSKPEGIFQKHCFKTLRWKSLCFVER